MKFVKKSFAEKQVHNELARRLTAYSRPAVDFTAHLCVKKDHPVHGRSTTALNVDNVQTGIPFLYATWRSKDRLENCCGRGFDYRHILPTSFRQHQIFHWPGLD
ncbi:hypothetical protein LSAT2_015299 [Lamellibrachia satsuma]|nr:hypothetical protein LSAT2_015299 [Lamellibrachia satsuma]